MTTSEAGAQPALPRGRADRPAPRGHALAGRRTDEPPASGPRASASAARRAGAWRGAATPWLFQAPVLVSLAVWVYGPLVFTGVLSLLDWDLISPHPKFVGLTNYRQLVENPEFGNAVLRTGLYVLALLPFATVVPMALAIMLWKRPGRASGIYRSLLFVPVMLAPVANALSWRFVLDPLGGIVNEVFGGLGLPQRDWLGDPSFALPAITLITAAKFVAMHLLLYGAALAGVDRRSLDAARVDGATEWEITRHLVVPQLVRTTALLAFLCAVFAGQWTFTNIVVLTDGGPDDTTDNVYFRLYQYAFTFFDAGTGAAAAMMIVGGLALAFAVVSLPRRRRATG
ncbi:ABC transporter permease [Pseudofrankia asymbiotica]|uniref:ABC transporter permease n=2 Tax=Pseudofrankia asymbiotica TaxID=1834516 RepID=A0A1V2IE93_9ACTN|nr:ABC transporter permease [Pseudofrankia asymbiotica]